MTQHTCTTTATTLDGQPPPPCPACEDRSVRFERDGFMFKLRTMVWGSTGWEQGGDTTAAEIARAGFTSTAEAALVLNELQQAHVREVSALRAELAHLAEAAELLRECERFNLGTSTPPHRPDAGAVITIIDKINAWHERDQQSAPVAPESAKSGIHTDDIQRLCTHCGSVVLKEGAKVTTGEPDSIRLDTETHCVDEGERVEGAKVAEGASSSEFACDRCKDTHVVETAHGKQHCTSCPVPCSGCRKDGFGAYCAQVPCPCSCHKKRIVLQDRIRDLGAETEALRQRATSAESELELTIKRAAATQHALRRRAHNQRTELNRMERALAGERKAHHEAAGKLRDLTAERESLRKSIQVRDAIWAGLGQWLDEEVSAEFGDNISVLERVQRKMANLDAASLRSKPSADSEGKEDSRSAASNSGASDSVSTVAPRVEETGLLRESATGEAKPADRTWYPSPYHVAEAYMPGPNPTVCSVCGEPLLPKMCGCFEETVEDCAARKPGTCFGEPGDSATGEAKPAEPSRTVRLTPPRAKTLDPDAVAAALGAEPDPNPAEPDDGLHHVRREPSVWKCGDGATVIEWGGRFCRLGVNIETSGEIGWFSVGKWPPDGKSGTVIAASTKPAECTCTGESFEKLMAGGGHGPDCPLRNRPASKAGEIRCPGCMGRNGEHEPRCRQPAPKAADLGENCSKCGAGPAEPCDRGVDHSGPEKPAQMAAFAVGRTCWCPKTTGQRMSPGEHEPMCPLRNPHHPRWSAKVSTQHVEPSDPAPPVESPADLLTRSELVAAIRKVCGGKGYLSHLIWSEIAAELSKAGRQ